MSKQLEQEQGMTDPHKIRSAIGELLQTPYANVIVEAVVKADPQTEGMSSTRYVITADVTGYNEEAS